MKFSVCHCQHISKNLAAKSSFAFWKNTLLITPKKTLLQCGRLFIQFISVQKRSARAARAILRLVWNAPAGVSEKALPHGSGTGAGPAASHIGCVDLEKNLLTPLSQSLFKCHLLYIFIVRCTVVYLIKLYWFKSDSSSVSVVFLTEFVLD